MTFPAFDLIILLPTSGEVNGLAKQFPGKFSIIPVGQFNLRVFSCHKEINGKSLSIGLVQTGMGQNRAEQVLEEILKTLKPTRLLLAGVAGGLAPALKTGEIILAGNMLDSAGNCIFLEENTQLLNAPGFWKTRTIFSCDNFVDSPEEKQKLHHQFNADCVEMEGRGCIKAISKSPVKPSFSQLRVILDPAELAVSPEISQLVLPDGHTNWRRLILLILKKPWIIRELLHFQKLSELSLQSLRKAVEQFVQASSL